QGNATKGAGSRRLACHSAAQGSAGASASRSTSRGSVAARQDEQTDPDAAVGARDLELVEHDGELLAPVVVDRGAAVRVPETTAPLGHSPSDRGLRRA